MRTDSASHCFCVRDIDVAIAFYTERMGFQVRFAVPKEPPPHSVLGRDEVAFI